MGKSLYSLMLSDEVIARIDREAFKAGTNRSQLIDHILAEHCSFETPERFIEEIFRRVDAVFGEGGELISQLIPHQSTMQLRTVLAYRYRPTLRYDLRLYKAPQDACIGELSLMLRTQAVELISLTASFAEAWIPAERRLLEAYGYCPRYQLQGARLTRTLHLPPQTEAGGAAAISENLSAYVSLLDEAFKGFVAGEYGKAELSGLLREWAAAGKLI